MLSNVTASCWVLIGVISSLGRQGAEQRLSVRQSYMRLGNAGRLVCFRFVLGATNSSRSTEWKRRALKEDELFSDITWVDTEDRNCAKKSFLWLWHASRQNVLSAAWIGKADDDSFINTLALEADLKQLGTVVNPHTQPAVVGLINLATAWSPLEGRPPTSYAGRPWYGCCYH
mmetsp:Transcript_25685/g.65279  ORF Transcript_25685/g.65279 Transcript_25685/m.65279 type:complete len:173 (+) Transcript_25685:78-596(+)